MECEAVSVLVLSSAALNEAGVRNRARLAGVMTNVEGELSEEPVGSFHSFSAAASKRTNLLKPRIVQFLEELPELHFSLPSIAKALGANPNSLGPYLSELVQSGKVERRGRGLYGANTASKV